MNKKVLIIFCLFILVLKVNAQNRNSYFKKVFTEADTLRGNLSKYRTCFDVTYYDLKVEFNIENKSIVGTNDIYFEVKHDLDTLQIDLFDNLNISKIEFDGQELKYFRKFNAVFVIFPRTLFQETRGVLTVNYDGIPKIAIRPPWDGGFVYSKDDFGTDWLAVSCEGIGASIWWPNKDHLSDEPDSMDIHLIVPQKFNAISNGNLVSAIQINSKQTDYHWQVSYPINNYNVTFNIGNYSHFQDTLKYKDGEVLKLDYYVLSNHVDTAKVHFQQVKPMLRIYDKYFGKYPFMKDGYALVETPYLGMEHQSCISYGNKFNIGYLGGRMPDSMYWDFIIIHESGHEYFGNSVSCKDHAEMWIHEAFTTYMEALYVENTLGYDKALEYLEYQTQYIKNLEPVIGPMNVNFGEWNSSDHYFKGSWILHTLRNTISQDSVFFDILRTFYDQHKCGFATTDDFVKLVNEKAKRDYTNFFEQYLYHPSIPKLQFRSKKNGNGIILTFRWSASTPKFDMPIKISKNEEFAIWLNPTTEWQDVELSDIEEDAIRFDSRLYLVDLQRVNDNFK